MLVGLGYSGNVGRRINQGVDNNHPEKLRQRQAQPQMFLLAQSLPTQCMMVMMMLLCEKQIVPSSFLSKKREKDKHLAQGGPKGKAKIL